MKLREYMRAEQISQADMAIKLGVSQGLVWQWLSWLDDPATGTRITAERAISIERETGGAVTRAEIRPDIFGVDTFAERRAVSNG